MSEDLRQNSLAASESPAQESTATGEPTEFRAVPSETLFLNFHIYRGGKVEVFPSFHYPSVPTITPGQRTPYAIELHDTHGRVLHAQRILLTDPYKDLDSASLEFYKPIPFDEDTARLVFTCGVPGSCEQKELLTVDVPENPPGVRIVSPRRGDRLSGRVRVAWEARHDTNKPLRYLLRYSNDGGQSWRAVAPRLSTTEYVVNLARLPGGERCRFQVLATEGIRTGVAVSEPFSVQQQPREAAIVEPASGTVVTPGQAIILVGESFSPDTGSAHPSELQWHSDLDGELEVGQEILVNTLRPGSHSVSLRAPDGYGGESEASIQIEVEPPTPRGHTSRTHPDHTSRDHDSGEVPYDQEGGHQEDGV